MKRCIPILFFLSLAACSTTQSQKFQTDLQNFTNDVHAVNQAIAAVSGSLASQCNGLATIGGSLLQLVGKSNAASKGLIAANAVIDSFCQAPPNDIPSAVKAVANEVNAAKSALAAAKAGN